MTTASIDTLRSRLPGLALDAETDPSAAAELERVEGELYAAERRQQRSRLAQSEQQRRDEAARARAAADATDAERRRVIALDATLTETLTTVEMQMATLSTTITAALATESEIGQSRHLQLRIAEFTMGEMFAAGITTLGGFSRRPLIQKEVGK